MFTVLEEIRIIEQRTKFDFNGEARSIWVFVMEILYGILSVFNLRHLFPFTFFARITAPMYEIFKFSMMFSGIYDFFNLVFFFLFVDDWRRWFWLFLRRKGALVIRC